MRSFFARTLLESLAAGALLSLLLLLATSARAATFNARSGENYGDTDDVQALQEVASDPELYDPNPLTNQLQSQPQETEEAGNQNKALPPEPVLIYPKKQLIRHIDHFEKWTGDVPIYRYDEGEVDDPSAQGAH